MNKLITKKKVILIIILILAFVLPTELITFLKVRSSNPAQAKDALLSPLAQDQPEEVKEEPERIYSLDYYLNLSQSFLEKATRLANDNQNQNKTEKLKIINTLNQSLKAVNQAIEYYPDQPEAYLTRAQLYQKIKHLWPEVDQLAKNDLEIANQLMVNSEQPPQPNSSTENTHPLDFIPAQKADLAQKITIAAPEEKKSIKDSESEITTNALSGTGVLPAQETEVTIQNQQLTPDSLVYVVPKGDIDNQVLYIKSRKNNQWFKVGLDQPNDKDIQFSWWIIKK